MIRLYDTLARRLSALAADALPLLARIIFAAVLAGYFWASALTKIGPGPLGFLTPADGAYFQIFPRQVAAAGYDVSQLGLFARLVATAGMWAEFALPLLITLGLFTRLAAVGMIGFITVQTLTDIRGHGLAGADVGYWFDRDSASLIADQRALWMVLLAGLVLLGGGFLSVDRWLTGRRGSRSPLDF